MNPTFGTTHHDHDPVVPVRPPEKKEHPLIELARFALIALIIVLPIRFFIAQPFIVSGASMETTFLDNEYLIVDQLSYRFEDPERGDVVIFRYPVDPSKFFIKRVIGLPGDTVSIEGHNVRISNDEHPDGIVLSEPYVKHMDETRMTVSLGAGEYFVMGDNRDESSDSRTWGVLPETNIVGRAILRLFPIQNVDVFPGAYEFEALETS